MRSKADETLVIVENEVTSDMLILLLRESDLSVITSTREQCRTCARGNTYNFVTQNSDFCVTVALLDIMRCIV